MKKVIGILLVMGLLLTISSVAMASETNWLFYLKGMSATGTNATEELRMGTMSAATDGWDGSLDAHWSTVNLKTSAGAVIYNDPALEADKPYTKNNTMGSITAPGVKSWTVLLWVGTTFAGDSLKLQWKGSTSNAVPTSIGGTPYDLTVSVLADPTGSHVGLSQKVTGLTGTYVNVMTFTGLGDAGVDGSGIRHDMGSLYDPYPTEEGHAIKLQVTMAPVVPEPGSLLALGSGLIGLVGFAVRRRR